MRNIFLIQCIQLEFMFFWHPNLLRAMMREIKLNLQNKYKWPMIKNPPCNDVGNRKNYILCQFWLLIIHGFRNNIAFATVCNWIFLFHLLVWQPCQNGNPIGKRNIELTHKNHKLCHYYYWIPFKNSNSLCKFVPCAMNHLNGMLNSLYLSDMVRYILSLLYIFQLIYKNV